MKLVSGFFSAFAAEQRAIVGELWYEVSIMLDQVGISKKEHTFWK